MSRSDGGKYQERERERVCEFARSEEDSWATERTTCLYVRCTCMFYVKRYMRRDINKDDMGVCHCFLRHDYSKADFLSTFTDIIICFYWFCYYFSAHQRSVQVGSLSFVHFCLFACLLARTLCEIYHVCVRARTSLYGTLFPAPQCFRRSAPVFICIIIILSNHTYDTFDYGYTRIINAYRAIFSLFLHTMQF